MADAEEEEKELSIIGFVPYIHLSPTKVHEGKTIVIMAF